MAWMIAVLALGGMAAAGVEIWLSMRQHPRRIPYGWLVWTPLAFLALFALGMDDGEDPVGSGLLALIVSPFVYPVARGLLWLRFSSSLSMSQAEEAAAEAERMKYHAMDFGGVRTATTASSPAVAKPLRNAVESPVALSADTSRLDRATRERRPVWVRATETLFIVGACAVGLAIYLASMIGDFRSHREPSDEEMIAATLELNGYGGPRVTATGEICPDEISARYLWSAVGSAGRACVDSRTGQVSLWVEKRWPSATQ